MESFIDMKNVSKTFEVNKRAAGVSGMIANLVAPQYEKRQAVKDISFHIERGEMTGFIGPNGAGKSTTIKMLSGILYPDKGDIKVNGYIPYKQRKEYVGSIGVVFGQKSQLQWDLPEIVFFDEPTIGVDVVGKEGIRDFIRELNEKDRVTMIFTTHDMQDIEKTCKRLIIIDKGTKVYDGSLLGIREKYGTTRQLDVEFSSRCEIKPIEKVEIRELDHSDGRKKRFVFENKEVQINELMNHLLTNYDVKDINISEPEIEGIIRKIYNGEAS